MLVRLDQFVGMGHVIHALDMAFASEKNILLHGPAGHGKSTIVEAYLEEVSLRDQAFIQQFGEGMDEARIYGGLDLKKLETDGVFIYNTDRSFLPHRVAVFEELFDAPPIVLMSLKDTLTAGALRNGAQQVEMKTRVIIGITNRHPDEISDMGPAAHAITERFPLQVEVKWEKYEEADYAEMLRAVFGQEEHERGILTDEVIADLSGLLENVSAGTAQPVSPRTAVHAAELLAASAMTREDGTVTDQDLEALRYIDGIGPKLDDAISEAEEKRALAQASANLDRITAEVAELEQAVNSIADENDCKHMLKRCASLSSELATLVVQDADTNRKEDVTKLLDAYVSQTQGRLSELALKEAMAASEE